MEAKQEENIEFRSMNELKIGSFIVHDNNPCVIQDKTIHKTGKHGHAKADVDLRDIFTNKHSQACFSSDEHVPCPIVTRKRYTLVNIAEDGFVSLLDDKGKIDESIKLENDDVDKQIRTYFESQTEKSIEVTVLTALGKSKIIECKLC